MRIAIRFPPPLRRWHVALRDALAAQGHCVGCIAGRPVGLSLGVAMALGLQRRIFGPPVSMFDVVSGSPPSPPDAPDLVVALDGAARADPSLVVTFGGGQGDAALVASLAGQATPEVRVTAYRREGSADLVTAALAVEHRDILSRALDQVLRRVVTLVGVAVQRLESRMVHPQPIASVAANAPRVSALSHMSQALVQKIAGRVGIGPRPDVHWRIGYRVAPDGGARGHGEWSGAPFTILPDDGARFHADPMPFGHEGRSYLFFEDLPDATRTGVINCVEIIDGVASAPRTVLTQPFHLSYPLVLRHGGEIYMLPEMSAARRLQLFRAAPFPDRWVPDRILLDGLVAADATPVRHAGQWWIFATLADDGGSSWDQLALFHAPDLLGPWAPHRANPVLVDAGAARPAGAMWHEEGVLMRVAQDCRRGYGDGLAICRVDRLDEEGYAQTVVRRLVAPPVAEADGVHTLNRLGDLEVIDVRGKRTPRRRAVLRAAERG